MQLASEEMMMLHRPRVALAMAALIASSALPAANSADLATGNAPIAIPASQAPRQTYDAGTLRVVVPSAMTGGNYSVLELNESPGYRTPPHVHPNMDESFYVLEGTLELQMAGITHKLPAGSFVHIPRGTAHSQGSADDRPVRLLATFSPGAFDAFFLDRVELGKSVRRGDPDFQPRMLELVGKYSYWLQPAGAPDTR
jgi:quercetin dioxygenase-like cupin family protein